MGATGFTNSWTSGEICDDAWDRDDLQQINKGCETAQNYVIRIPGPLGKRRGFWLNGSVFNPAAAVRLVPFRRSVTDALVLEFGQDPVSGDGVVSVWQTNGSPLMNGGVQVQFASPYTAAQLSSLRYKQVADVIYFRSSLGLQPQQLVRTSDTEWAFSTPTFKNGPWLAENIDTTFTLTFTGTDVPDANAATGYGVMMAPQVNVPVVASQSLFTADMIGTQFRIRAGNGTASAREWVAATGTLVGWYALFNGNVYICTADNGHPVNALTPPVQTQGSQSDGDSTFEFITDGAGIIEITGVTDGFNAQCTIVTNMPVLSGQATSYFSQAAYSTLNGWPTAWPEIREERLVEGATSANLDYVDLTQTAGFTPSTEDFTPGTGTGTVIDTNGMRERVGVDGAQILWFSTATYLVCGTETGEYIIAGSVLDEPLSPSGITIKQPSSFGSADVYPQRAHNGLLYVARGAQTLREIAVDTQQGASGEDHSFLATHIAQRGFGQLAWVPDPDNNCWLRMNDGSFACFTYHKEQAVKGFTTQLLGGSLTVEDEIVMPGPGNLETLWIVASQTVGGVTNRLILMQSQVSDNLFMDAAQAYAGAAVNVIGGLALFNGQTVDVVANGAWYSGLTVEDGQVTLPNGATTTSAQVGFTYPCYFKSLKLNLRVFNGALLQRQRIASAIIDILTTECTIGADDGPGELISTRRASDVPAAQPHRVTREVTVTEQYDLETGWRDPRIVIQEQTPYNAVIYAIKPNRVVAGD